MKTAVMNGKADSRKGVHDILWGNPVFRILRVVIVAVYRKAVSGDEIVAIAVVVFIFCTDIVMADGGF